MILSCDSASGLAHVTTYGDSPDQQKRAADVGKRCANLAAVTERGVRCHLYVTRVAVAEDQDATQFGEELLEQKVPSAEIAAIPLRLIL